MNSARERDSDSASRRTSPKIKNALYDPADETVLIQASDGVWRGPADLSEPFTLINLPAPIFVMGATVFDTQPNGSYLVGSFSGLYRVDPIANRVVNLLADEAPDVQRRMRPAATMVTGWLASPNGDAYIATHYRVFFQALFRLKGSSVRLSLMAEQVASGSIASLQVDRPWEARGIEDRLAVLS